MDSWLALHLYAAVNAYVYGAIVGIVFALAHGVYLYDFGGNVVMLTSVADAALRVLAFPYACCRAWVNIEYRRATAIRAGHWLRVGSGLVH